MVGNYGSAKMVIDITSIDQGPDISDGVILAKDPNMTPVYLIDNGVKRWVTSQMVMDKFHFARDQIKLVPNIVLSFVIDGPNIT